MAIASRLLASLSICPFTVFPQSFLVKAELWCLNSGAKTHTDLRKTPASAPVLFACLGAHWLLPVLRRRRGVGSGTRAPHRNHARSPRRLRRHSAVAYFPRDTGPAGRLKSSLRSGRWPAH